MSVTTSKFTREDKKKLDRKRAINPALSAGAAGASGAALLANVGGMALRNTGQKKQFNDKLNDYEWVKREGASAKRMKAAKIGSKLQAKAIPITLAAGGINAAAAANGIQMSNLWNKKDKIKTVGVSKSLGGFLAGAAAHKAKKSGTQFALRELQAKGVIPNLSALAPTQRDKFFQGLGAGTLITAIAATPMLSSAFNRPGMDEFLPGVKK